MELVAVMPTAASPLSFLAVQAAQRFGKHSSPAAAAGQVQPADSRQAGAVAVKRPAFPQVKAPMAV